MFIYEDQIKVYDTDAAGVLFFGSIYRLMHNAFEAFLQSKGFALDKIVNSGDILFPVVHSEADYKTPLRAGDKLNIQVSVEGIGHTSVTVVIQFIQENGNIAATGKIIFVVINKTLWKKIEVPSGLRKALI